MAKDRPDLELLEFLENFWQTRNLSLTSTRLGIGTATGFRLLTKSRNLFGDHLFVKSGRSMLPTPFMEELIVKIKPVLEEIDSLTERKIFSVKEITDTIRIGCVDNAVFKFIAPSLKKIYSQAPNLRLSIVPLNEKFQHDLERGYLDLVIYAPKNLHVSELSKKFHYFRLPAVEHVYLVRKSHPLELLYKKKKQLTKEDLKNYKFVAIKYGYSQIPITIDTAGMEDGPSIAIDTPYFLTVPFILEATDFIARLPKGTAEKMVKQSNLTMLPSILLEKDIWSAVFLWHQRTQNSPVHQWFRSLLIAETNVNPSQGSNNPRNESESHN